ncbi:MAG: hypothetical protein ABF379_02165 [Akkermansiaceae bacterium]
MFIFEILATLSIISINVFNQCINKKAISIPAILSPMNPLAERVHFIASELTQLHATVKRLADTISGLKQEIMNEEVFKRPSPTSHLGLTPPPLPAQLPEPIEASELTPISAQPNLVLNGATSKSVEEVEVTAPSPQKLKTEFAGLKMHLGQVWSVRLGIVLLTTRFVFLSRYTYDSCVRDLSPGLRLSMMYLLSFFITGAGLFCERWKNNLKGYGRIVAASASLA